MICGWIGSPTILAGVGSLTPSEPLAIGVDDAPSTMSDDVGRAVETAGFSEALLEATAVDVLWLELPSGEGVVEGPALDVNPFATELPGLAVADEDEVEVLPSRGSTAYRSATDIGQLAASNTIETAIRIHLGRISSDLEIECSGCESQHRLVSRYMR